MKSINLGESKGVRRGGRSLAALIALAAIIAMLAGCGGGGGGGGTPVAANVTLSGTFTYGGAKQAAGYTVSVEGASPANTTTTDANSKFTLPRTVPSGTTITLDLGTSGGVFATQVVNEIGRAHV